MIRSAFLASAVLFAIACGGSSSSSDDAENASDDAGASDGTYAQIDGGTSRSGGGASNRDAGGATDSAVTTQTTRVDSGTESGAANGVDNALTFGGDCSPDMENLDVVTNTSSYDSIGVVNGSDPLDGDVQIAVSDSSLDVVRLSTAERVGPPQNDLVINVTSGGVVFTNVCNVSAGGCTYDAASKVYEGDPITGTFTINEYDPESGKLDVAFDGVVLQSTQSTAICRVNGTLTTQHLYP
jgi:hypothetical protein